jgi:hypothetical protein
VKGALVDISTEIEALRDLIQGRQSELEKVLDAIKYKLWDGLPRGTDGNARFALETWKKTKEIVEKRLGEILESYPEIAVPAPPRSQAEIDAEAQKQIMDDKWFEM